MTNSPSPKSPAPNRYNLLAVLGVFGLAVIGVAFLVLAVVLLVRGPGTNSPASASATPLADVATQMVFIPTTTESPTHGHARPHRSALGHRAGRHRHASRRPPRADVSITKPANVRTGPGLDYQLIAGINTGETAPAIGRDSSATGLPSVLPAARRRRLGIEPGIHARRQYQRLARHRSRAAAAAAAGRHGRSAHQPAAAPPPAGPPTRRRFPARAASSRPPMPPSALKTMWSRPTPTSGSTSR